MKRKQLDLYAECNVEPRAPMDVFTAECCARCVNPDCVRSRVGGSKFEARVSTWYERLFRDVPRMSTEDARFHQIAGQKFVLIDPERLTSGASGWVDPREHKSKSVQVPVQLEPAQESTTLTETPVQPESPVERQRQASPDLAWVNTPAQQGRMIGAAAPAPQWRTAPGQANEDVVVKTGAKIRIGQ